MPSGWNDETPLLSTPSIVVMLAVFVMRTPLVVPEKRAIVESARLTESKKPDVAPPICVAPVPPATLKFADLNAAPVIEPAPDKSMPFAMVGVPLIARIEPVVLSGLALMASPTWMRLPHPTAPL